MLACEADFNHTPPPLRVLFWNRCGEKRVTTSETGRGTRRKGRRLRPRPGVPARSSRLGGCSSGRRRGAPSWRLRRRSRRYAALGMGIERATYCCVQCRRWEGLCACPAPARFLLLLHRLHHMHRARRGCRLPSLACVALPPTHQQRSVSPERF